jgi:hypothetical protein
MTVSQAREDSSHSSTIPAHVRILLSEDDACQMYSLSKPVFRDLVAAGYIHPVKLPTGVRRNLYLRSDLDALAAKLAAS